MLRANYKTLGYNVTVTENLFSAFPEKREEFMQLFLDASGLEIKNPNYSNQEF